MRVITGTLRAHRRGFGFVKGDAEEVFIPKREMRGAVDGDEVEVQVSPIRNEKGLEGKIKQVLKRGRQHAAGTICEIYKKIPYAYVPLLGDELMRIKCQEKLQIGDRISIQIEEWGSQKKEPVGRMIDHLGHISEPGCDINAAIEEFELEGDFPPQVREEAKAFGTSVGEIGDRLDLRDLVTITIDPKTAKDFDDALSLRVDERGHFHLAVHIADVSHYVKPGSHLDNEAKKRCNSTYLPGTVIPMLPHELSSNLCSLMPKVDRFAVSVMMEMDSKGEVVDYSFGRSVIHSNKRFSYEEAYEVLKGKESPHKELLENLVKLCHVLKKRRSERGSIEFALPDTQLRLDSKGMPTHVEIVEYDITHQLVEECMLAANALVAKHLTSKNRPLAYRVHDEPFDEKMKDFAATVTALGYKLSPKPEAEELQLFFDEVRETALGKFFATLFIRTMKMAIYSTDNIGHFGLSLEHYTHFTSPIRRYVDLMVHRALLGEPVDDLDDIAEACSEKERLSARAEGSVLNLKKLRYLQMKAKNRDHFEAVVTAVKPNGFVFEVGEFLLEGFVPLAAFEDHFSFDASTMSVKSRRDSYKTGDRIEVYPDEIDLITQDVVWSIY